MFSAVGEFVNQNRFIGFISCLNDTFKFVIIDSVTEKGISATKYHASDAQRFIDQFSTMHGTFKAVIADLFCLDLQSTPFKISNIFCEKLKEKLNAFKIPSYFISEESYLFTSLLIAANVEVGINETVLIIMPCKTEGSKSDVLAVGELKFTAKGYQQVNQKILQYDRKIKPKIFCQQICGSTNPQKIIVSTVQFKRIPFKKIFKSMDLIELDSITEPFRDQFVTETCKWMMNKSYVKYHILPTCAKSIHVYGNYGSEGNILDIIKINLGDPLPITKTATFTRSVPEAYVKFEDKNIGFFQKLELTKQCHAFQVTATVDEENFHTIQAASLLLLNMDILPSKMDALVNEKIPFIGFFQNSSVIGIYNVSKDGYEFLDEWNGIYGNDCFISFEQKKPKYGQEAMDAIKTKHSFVVFDIIKIMSMPPDNIKADKTWGFTFTENAGNPVLLEFDNFDGTKKAASPSFLMAMYLRQHLKAIEAKTGKKPKEIAIYIMKEYEEDEMDRIKEGLKESCQLLKLDVRFVETKCFEADGAEFNVQKLL